MFVMARNGRVASLATEVEELKREKLRVDGHVENFFKKIPAESLRRGRFVSRISDIQGCGTDF